MNRQIYEQIDFRRPRIIFFLNMIMDYTFTHSVQMKDLMNFVVILLIVLMAFGIVRQAITYPDEEPNWHLVKFIFLKPYFMLYGEVYAPEIDRKCFSNNKPSDRSQVLQGFCVYYSKILHCSLLTHKYN